MSVTTAQAVSLLENVLFESKTLATANAAGWVSLSNLNSSYSTVSGLAGAMAQTAEATIAQQVIRYYEGALGRSPSGAEVAYYVNIVENGNAAAGIPAMTAAQINEGASAVPGATWNQIASFFAASPEFAFASAGGNVVNLLYLNILNRAPNAAEITYYQNLLNSGTSVSTLVQYFTTSPEYQGKVDSQIQSNITTYGATVANGGTAPSSIGTISTPITITNVALTTGVDNITVSGNTVVTATVQGSTTVISTLNPLDTITGTGSNNTLVVNDASTGAGAASADLTVFGSVSGITDLKLTSATGLHLGAADVSSWAGLNTAAFTLASITTDQTVTAAGTTAVTVTAKDAATVAGITVDGGSTVTVNFTYGTSGTPLDDSTKTITVNGSKGATTAVTVNQTDASTAGTGKAAQVVIADPYQGSTTHTSTIATVTLGGATSGLTDSIASDVLTTLNVANSTDSISVTAAAGTRALTVNLDGDTAGTISDATATSAIVNAVNDDVSGVGLSFAAAKAITFGGANNLGLGTVTAAAATTATITGAGGVTANLSGLNAAAVIDASGSTGTNKISLGAGETYTGGTGASVITVSADATKAIKAGSGTSDVLVVNYAQTANTYTNVSGFEVLGTGAASTGTYDLSKLGSTTGAEVTTYNAGGSVTFSNGSATQSLTIDSSLTGANTVSVTQSSAAAAASTSTLTLNLGGAKSQGITTQGATAVAQVDKLAVAGTPNHDGTVSVTIAGTTHVYTETGADTTATALAADLASFITTNFSGFTATAATGNISITDGTAGVAFAASATTTDTGAPTFTASITTAAVPGGTNVITATGYTNVTVNSVGDGKAATQSGTENVTGISDTALKTLVVTGNESVVITDANSVVTSIDTTAIGKGLVADLSNVVTGTGGLTVTAGAGAVYVVDAHEAAGKNDVITAGDGANHITISSATVSTSTITLGNGNNTVTLTGHLGVDTVTVGTGTNTIVLGSGQDLVTVGAHNGTSVTDSITVGQATTANTYSTLTGLVHGDNVTFSSGHGTDAWLGGSVTAAQITLNASTAAFADYISAAAAGDGSANSVVSWFQYNGATYIVQDNSASTSFVSGADNIVKLAGLVNLGATGALATLGVHVVHL